MIQKLKFLLKINKIFKNKNTLHVINDTNVSFSYHKIHIRKKGPAKTGAFVLKQTRKNTTSLIFNAANRVTEIFIALIGQDCFIRTVGKNYER